LLRRIYDDPMTRSNDWRLVRNERGLIVGVHSRSEAKPIRRAHFRSEHAGFEEAASYAEWRFMAVREPLLRDRRPSPPDAGASGSAAPASRPVSAPPSRPVGEVPHPPNERFRLTQPMPAWSSQLLTWRIASQNNVVRLHI
jgi:hypothetical protein